MVQPTVKISPSYQADSELTSNAHTQKLEPIEQLREGDWSEFTREKIATLPQVWTRGLIYLLVFFNAVVIPWAMIAQVDETGSAKGRLEPQGKSFEVDAPVGGKVSQVLVSEGELVQAHQPLLELESEPLQNQLQQVREQLQGQKAHLTQLELLESQLLVALRTQEQQNQAQAAEKQAQVEQAQQNLQALKNNYNLQQEEQLALVAQAQQSLDHAQNAHNLVGKRWDNVQRELERYRNAFERGIVAEIQLVEREDAAYERQQLYERTKSDIEQTKLRLAEQKSSYQRKIKQAQGRIEQAQLQLQEQQKSYQTLNHRSKLAVLKNEEQLNNLQTQITSLSSEIAQSQSKIASLEFQLQQRVLKAPVRGVIYHLPHQREGAVVQSGEMVAEIAKQGAALVLRAQMATSESGTLHEGMAVKLKFDAYPFQDYGIIAGKLTRISPTSKIRETNQGQTATYDLEVDLQQDCIPHRNQCISLKPGQTATAEVIVRQRRIIDFILDPFKKLQKSGLEL